MKLAIVTRELAPYRTRLYEALTECAPSLEMQIVTGDQGSGSAHLPWRGPDISSPQLLIKKVGGPLLSIGRLSTRLPSFSTWKTLASFSPHIIWVHELSPFVYPAIFFSRIFNRPLIISTDFGDKYRSRLSLPHRVLQRYLLRLADLVIANTPDAAHNNRIVASKLIFAPHAIDTQRFIQKNLKHSACQVTTFLQVGGLMNVKGTDLLIKAFAEAYKINQNIKLQLLGHGEDVDKYRNLCMELGLEKAVEFLPFVTQGELSSFYSAADIFVLASRSDTYGVVVHEAAACGLPLLVSKFAGSAQVFVKGNENGAIFDPHEIPSFAKLILNSAIDNQLRDRSLKLSRKIAETYDVRTLARQIIQKLKTNELFRV